MQLQNMLKNTEAKFISGPSTRCRTTMSISTIFQQRNINIYKK